MLSSYFESPFTLDRLRTGPSAPYLDGFAEHLEKEGYAFETAQRHLRSAGHLGHYVETQNLGLDVVVFDVLKRFEEHLGCCCCQQSNGGTTDDVVFGAKRFLGYLGSSGSLEVVNFNKEKTPEPELVIKFKDWLENQCGLSKSTLRHYGEAVVPLIDSLGSDPAKYDPVSLRDFMIERSKDIGQGSVNHLVSGLRKFLRYLIGQGECPAGLERAIPAVAGWRHGSLPSYLSATEVDQIIGTCEESSLMGIRDKAIMLLFVRLGLRAGDVADLRLSLIDWSDGSFLVSGKSRREERLPLSQEVGDALVAYLEKRPQVGEDRVFLRIPAPHRPFTRNNSVSQIVTRRMRRAGVSAPRYGAHILRHTAATQMLRKGVGLYEIGSVLRHQSIDMTAHYAKIDIELLREVAQPWPEVLKC